MNDLTTQAMARLRAADPAATTPDAYAPQARALLERVLKESPTATPPGGDNRLAGRRRLAVGLAGAAAITTVTALAVVEPWSDQPASAYTVDRHSDGSVAVTFRPAQLKNPTKLNAELARAGARTVVIEMVPADQCTTPLDIDPAFRLPDDPTAQQLADQLARFPVHYDLGGDGVIVTIQPWRIPPSAVVAFGYTQHTMRGDRTTLVRPAVVVTPPSCMAIPTPPAK